MAPPKRPPSEITELNPEKLFLLLNPKSTMLKLDVLVKRIEFDAYFNGQLPVTIILAKGKSFETTLSLKDKKFYISLTQSQRTMQVNELALVVFKLNNLPVVSQCRIQQLFLNRCQLSSLDLRKIERKKISIDVQVSVMTSKLNEDIKNSELSVIRKLWSKDYLLEDVKPLREGGESTTYKTRDISASGICLLSSHENKDLVNRILKLNFKMALKIRPFEIEIFALVKKQSTLDNGGHVLHCTFFDNLPSFIFE